MNDETLPRDSTCLPLLVGSRMYCTTPTPRRIRLLLPSSPERPVITQSVTTELLLPSCSQFRAGNCFGGRLLAFHPSVRQRSMEMPEAAFSQKLRRRQSNSHPASARWQQCLGVKRHGVPKKVVHRCNVVLRTAHRLRFRVMAASQMVYTPSSNEMVEWVAGVLPFWHPP